MELNIETNETQKLLDRTLVKGKIHFSEKSTPSRMNVIDEIAKQLKVDKKLIVLKEIKTRFGTTTADFEAHIYNSEEFKNKVEPKHLLKRSEIKEAPKEEKKEEAAPVEEKKEAEVPKE